MSDYDYKAGKKRVDDILSNKLEIIEKEEIPSDDKFTFANGYYSWVTGLFIDIRDSSELFSDEDREKVAKIIRSFTSEIIEILRKDDNLREIGIRGDCVYAIYSTPNKIDDYEVVDKAFYINTYIKMLNKLLEDKDYPEIKVGIGISTDKELVVKAGRKDVGINSKVWIGDAVTKSANFSSLGNKNKLSAIVLSDKVYENVIDEIVNIDGEKAKGWFKKHNSFDYGTYYDCCVVKKDFDNWINGGMKEE